MVEKVDLQKSLSSLYRASVKKPSVIEVPVLNYLMIDGRGNPSGQAFQEAVSTLYPVAYILKFAVREKLEIDYGVMPLEVVWKVNRERKGDFAWTAMIMQPPFIDGELFEQAKREAVIRKDPPRIHDLRLEGLEEGACLQMLHVGSYEEMNGTLEKMLIYIGENGYRSGRDTHDIYLNSIKKTRPENLKTDMRLPIWKS